VSSTTVANSTASGGAAEQPAPMMVVPDLMTARLESTPDTVAFNVDGVDGPTFAEWDRRATSVAHGLLARGASTGTRLALLFEGMDWEAYAVAYLGLLKAGATAVHLNTGLEPVEVTRRLKQCQVAGIVHASTLAAPADFDGWTATPADLDSGTTDPVPVEISPLDISDIHYTSGTTGLPKAYQVPHGNLTYGRSPGWFKQFGDAEYMLVPMVLGTGTSATVINIALSSPAVVVLVDPHSTERMGEVAARLRVGSVMLTPVIAMDIIERRLTERFDLSSVHTLACGSAPLAPATANILLAMFPGAKISTACSQSEAGPALVVNVYDPECQTSVGRPSPITELRITGEDGEPLPTGTVGEIWLRTPAPKRTYLDLPDITDRLVADGWHRTGDLGRLDDEGRLHLFDRAVDVIRVGGVMVSSLEVEAAAYGCPGVVECAAVEVSDPADGQRVLLVARLAPLTTPAELEAHLDAQLDERRRPVRVVVQSDPLPRTLNGKVLKRELRARFRQD
jgi:fatty-acyl-CoA synthase